MAETTQKNFRMSEPALRLLHSVARALGATETDVIQTCVAKYALEIGQDVERAKELLLQQICELAAKSPVLHSRAKESMALNEEPRRGKETREAADVHSGQSAAGELTAMAGQGWKEKGKKKT